MATSGAGITLSDLVGQFNVPQDSLNRKFTDEHALQFSVNLTTWERLAPHLGLSKQQIEAIKRDNNSEEEKRAATLKKWKECFAFRATYRNLIEALLAIERADLASDLCELIASPQVPLGSPLVSLTPQQGVDHGSLPPSSPPPMSPEPTSPQSSSGISVGSDPNSPHQLTFASSESVSKSTLVKNFEYKFLDVVKRVEELLTNTPLEELQRIASHPRSDTKGQFGRIFEKRIKRIYRAKNIGELFAVLSYFWDYLQPDYLIEIVERCDNSEAQRVVSEYEQELSIFKKQITLREYLGKRLCNLDEIEQKDIKAKLENEWYEKTLEDLERLRCAFADEFSLLRLVPKLNGLLSNSIIVIFSLPRSVELDHDQLCKFFRSYNALQVVVDGVCIFDVESRESQDNEGSGNTAGYVTEFGQEKEKLEEEIQQLRKLKVSDTSEQWKITAQGRERYLAVGTRDTLIVVSSESLEGPDIVPRLEVELTKNDIEKLQRLNLPNQWKDDASILVARYKMDKTDECNVVGVERSIPGDGLTKKYVLEEIKSLMTSTTKDGVRICYIGPGKKDTGDWCFEDGFITFRDLAELYCNCFKGHVLSITADCSYSGRWVKELMKFLEEQGVKPCGHSAREKGILIKVFASCKPTEIPYRLLYSVRAKLNDKNTGMALIQYSGFEVAKDQHVYTRDPTKLRCNASSFEEPCTFSPECTWERWETRDRINLVRGEDCGRPVWHYVLLTDDEEKIKEFKEFTMGANAGKHTTDISKYGQVIKSGWGKDPSDDVKEWMMKNYGLN